MTKEQIFAAFAYDMACADGSLSKEEAKRTGLLASANNLDGLAVVEAIKKEMEHPSNLNEVVSLMTDDDKELVFFAAKRIAMADGKIASKEVKRLHHYCKLFGWGASYVTVEYFQLLKENPSLLIQGIDF
jgi:tellurite resistance protein